MQGKNKKNNRRAKSLILFCAFTAIVLTVSTYAWFIGMRTVNVAAFDVEIQATESLMLSLDGKKWSNTVYISKDTLNDVSYTGHTNSWGGEGLIPMSTVGAMDEAASRMVLFEKSSHTATAGGYRLMSSRVNNFTNAEGTIPTVSKRIDTLHKKMQTLLSFAGHVSQTEEIVQTKEDRRGVSVVHSFIDLPKKSEGDKMNIISTLCDAAFSHRVCTVTYRSNDQTAKTYDIMPLIVFSFQGGIYTICETKKYDYWCKLAVERIENLETTDEKFERKTTLDVVYTLTDPFGIIQCDQFKIEVLLDRTNAQMLMDRDWPNDRVSFSEPDENGNVVFSCITSGEFEVLRWLRYLGSGAKLISPPELVEKLKASIKDLEKTYF